MVLATLVVLLDLRYGWARGVDLAILGAATAFVATLGVTSEMEGRDPRVYQTVLFVTTLVLLGAVLERLGGGVAWKAALLAAAATWFARERGSGTCALVAALSGGGAVLALARELGVGEDGERWVLVGLAAVFALSAVDVRDRRPRTAAMLAVAGGTATLAIAAGFLFGGFFAYEESGGDGGVGWQLLVLGAGFGLCALSGVERQPGPGYVGLLNLVAFVLLAANGGSLLGWPLVLAAIAVALLAIGLRPARPLPPPPEPPEPPVEPLPLRPRG